MTHHDVIITGAGPAGTVCAHQLGKNGIDVLLLDKEEFPRYKPCGGGVVRKAINLLEDVLGEGQLESLFNSEIVENNACKVHFNYHRSNLEFEVTRKEASISMVDRKKFDQWLLEHALSQGVQFQDKTNVVSYERHWNIHLITERNEYTCHFLVQAMGWNGLGPGWLDHYRTIMPAYECKIKPKPAILETYRGTARFDLGIPARGYAWLFPKADHLSAGVLTTRKEKINLKNHFDQYLALLGLDNAEVIEQHGSVIPVSPRKNLFDEPDVLYVGDAAGFADPIVAEGISNALISGGDGCKCADRRKPGSTKGSGYL